MSFLHLPGFFSPLWRWGTGFIQALKALPFSLACLLGTVAVCLRAAPWGLTKADFWDAFGTADAASAPLKAWTNYKLHISAMVSGKGETQLCSSKSTNWEHFFRSCAGRHLWGHHLSALCLVASKACRENIFLLLHLSSFCWIQSKTRTLFRVSRQADMTAAPNSEIQWLIQMFLNVCVPVD